MEQPPSRDAVRTAGTARVATARAVLAERINEVAPAQRAIDVAKHEAAAGVARVEAKLKAEIGVLEELHTEKERVSAARAKLKTMERQQPARRAELQSKIQAARREEDRLETALQVELGRRERDHVQAVALGQAEVNASVEKHRRTVEAAKSAEFELNAAVAAPVGWEIDPTAWLPDEMVLTILLLAPNESMWSYTCAVVCRRWYGLLKQSAIIVQRRKQMERWGAYDRRWIMPRALEGNPSGVRAVAIAPTGRVYTGAADGTVRVWRPRASGIEGTHLQLLEGHTAPITALVVGFENKVYSGSCDCTVRVWSGIDGAHLQTLEGHSQFVRALAVGVEGRVYSGSLDTTVRVWSGNDGALLHVLAGNAAVHALAVGLDGAVHAGLANGDIKVWSGLDGKHLRTLRWPGCASITSLAVGLNGVLFAGTCAAPDFFQGLYRDNIVLFSVSDGAHIGSLCSQYSERGPDLYSIRTYCSPRVNALAVGLDGKLYAALDTGGIHVFSGPGASSHLQTLRGHGFSVGCIAVSPSDDTVCSGSGREAFARVW
jgi:hypothetical protein